MQTKHNPSQNFNLWKSEAQTELSHLINDLADFNTFNHTQHYKVQINYSTKLLVEYGEWKKEEPKNDNSLDSYFRVFSLTLCSDISSIDGFSFYHLTKNYYKLLNRKVPYWEGIVGFKNPPENVTKELKTAFTDLDFDIEITPLWTKDQILKTYTELFENRKFKYQNHNVYALYNHQGYIDFYTKLQKVIPDWNVLKRITVLNHNNSNVFHRKAELELLHQLNKTDPYSMLSTQKTNPFSRSGA